ncbi:plasmid mobilization protein [Sphingobium yanoikuyae]|uniref:plasmid mobilization protein n=1 Tax=Sphingobium yanoikuyae TaxID=13690 RepID=UPI000846DCAD
MKLPGQTGTEVRVRTIVLTTRWSPAEHSRLEEIAEFSDCSKAEALRRLVQQGQPMILPSRLLVSEVRRIGVNINQLAKRANVSGQVDHDALIEAYRDLLSATRMLLR